MGETLTAVLGAVPRVRRKLSPRVDPARLRKMVMDLVNLDIAKTTGKSGIAEFLGQRVAAPAARSVARSTLRAAGDKLARLAGGPIGQGTLMAILDAAQHPSGADPYSDDERLRAYGIRRAGEGGGSDDWPDWSTDQAPATDEVDEEMLLAEAQEEELPPLVPPPTRRLQMAPIAVSGRGPEEQAMDMMASRSMRRTRARMGLDEPRDLAQILREGPASVEAPGVLDETEAARRRKQDIQAETWQSIIEKTGIDPSREALPAGFDIGQLTGRERFVLRQLGAIKPSEPKRQPRPRPGLARRRGGK